MGFYTRRSLPTLTTTPRSYNQVVPSRLSKRPQFRWSGCQHPFHQRQSTLLKRYVSAVAGSRRQVSPAQRSFLATFALACCGVITNSRDHIVLIQVFELVCAGTPHYFQASNTAEWVYYILEMLKKRAGDEAEANKAQSALSTSGQPSHCDVQTRSCGELCSTCFASVASLTLLNA